MSENSKKVIVIGDGCVGKTCLVSKISEGKFINNYHTTIGGKLGELDGAGLLESLLTENKFSLLFIVHSLSTVSSGCSLFSPSLPPSLPPPVNLCS